MTHYTTSGAAMAPQYLTPKQKAYVDALPKPVQSVPMNERAICAYTYADARGTRHRLIERKGDTLVMACEDGSRVTVSYPVFMMNFEVAN